ncbi:MAG: tetratricopeptide repeat protein [Paramuribaculum sp.]|nr:tetratricopeptide repeat protein [Paramuribaculum sp.]
MNLLPFLLLLFPMILVGCSDSHDRRLECVNAMTITDTRGALAALDSIDPATLGEADRHFRDLLSVKAADKEYVRHTSDSIILDVIDYYSNAGDDTLCAEAFYYGGRVYSDMGDYPTALRYFQNALDILPKNTPQQSLRSCVLSQTGRLLTQIRLNEQAIPYLKEAISIELNTKDSVGLMWDYELLGSIYLRLKDYSKAQELYTQARNLYKRTSPRDQKTWGMPGYG